MKISAKGSAFAFFSYQVHVQVCKPISLSCFRNAKTSRRGGIDVNQEWKLFLKCKKKVGVGWAGGCDTRIEVI